ALPAQRHTPRHLLPLCQRQAAALARRRRDVSLVRAARRADQPALSELRGRKRQLAMLDYDDLLLYWHALSRDSVVGNEIASQFDQILVDDHQDLNAFQVEILRELRRERRGLTAVGDDAQAIYGVRAASADHILNFSEHFPGATVIALTRNYRSTQPIL